MILIPPQALEGNIDEFYTEFRSTSELLGYFPCSNTEDIWCAYYTVLSKDKMQRVVPVFYEPNLDFDTGDAGSGPALYFMGCDDGHLGLRFDNREEAIEWIKTCPYVDYDHLYRDYGTGKVKLLYRN